MLREGASISEMSRELGWLRHTCHGALAGSDQLASGERIYRLAAPADAA